MKKRFFLTIIFLVLLAGAFLRQDNKEKNNETVSVVEEITIADGKAVHSADKALGNIYFDLIIPESSVIMVCVYTYVCYIEFKTGSVDRKPKYRKQMPRGNLAFI